MDLIKAVFALFPPQDIGITDTRQSGMMVLPGKSVFLLALLVVDLRVLGRQTAPLPFNSTEMEVVKDLFQEFCPYTSLCTRERLYTYMYQDGGRNWPCCEQCSCDEECVKENSCCFDKPNLHEFDMESDNGTFCISNVVLGDTDQFLTFHVMVHTCKDTDADPQLQEQCEQPDDDDIYATVPVTDRNTGVIYRNKYCALCNGVASYEIWSVLMMHERDTFMQVSEADLTTPQEIYRFALSNDLMISALAFPPDDMDHSTKICSIVTIESCWSTWTPTTWWEELLGSACAAIDSPFKNYANVFCYYCARGLRPPALCPKPTSSKDILSMRGFCTLLNFETTLPSEQKTEQVIPQSCSVGEIYDVHLEACREWHCPQGQNRRGGTCRPLLLPVFGLQVGLPLSLTVATDTYNMTGAPAAFSEVIEARLYAALHRQRLVRIIFTMNTTFTSAPTSVFFALALVKIEAGEDAVLVYPSLYRGLSAIPGTLPVLLGNVTTHVTIGIAPDCPFFGYYSTSEYARQLRVPNLNYIFVNVSQGLTDYILSFRKTLFCRQIILNDSEFDVSGTIICLKANRACLTPMEYQLVNTSTLSVRVCVDDYMSAAGQNNISDSNLVQVMLVFLLVQVLN